MELCFDKELLEFLKPEDVIYLSILLCDGYDVDSFCSTKVYEKLLEFYIDEIPYGTLRFKTGDADIWIMSRLKERIVRNVEGVKE